MQVEVELPKMKWPRLKLRWQLLFSYLPVTLIPVLLIGLVVHNVAEQSLNVLVTQEAQQSAYAVSGAFSQYYLSNGSWNGVGRLIAQFRPPLGLLPNAQFMAVPAGPANNPPNFPGQQPGMPSGNVVNDPQGVMPSNGPVDNSPGGPKMGMPSVMVVAAQPGQILIADNTGRVIASDNPDAAGQILSTNVLAHGAPERQLLDTISSALALTGLLTFIIAVGLALWLSNHLTTPVRDLLVGVKQLANGHWSEPLRIGSRNEFADLTDAFNTMADQLTRQQQQQRQMIADIAHDLRTPLSIIGLEIAGIQSGLQTPEEATRSLQEEVDWLQHLIDDLHTLSTMDTGQFQLYPDNTALTSYLCDLCNQWQTMASAQEKTLVCDVPADLPIVWIDPFRMRQVLTNLLSNALQYTPKGTQITLQGRTGINRVEISVTDNGSGITPEDLPHVFDRFYRADRARSRGRHEHGSGLGLSIAYQLVQLHRGILRVDSQWGVGTTFTISLPVA